MSIRSLEEKSLYFGRNGPDPRISKPARSQKGLCNRRLRALTKGDDQYHQDFRQNFDLYSRRVVRLAYKLLGNKEEAEDAAQEVFISVYQKASTFRGDSQFSTWLYRLTINTAFATLRRQKRRREIFYNDFLPQFQKDGHYRRRSVADWSNEIEERSYNGELRQILNSALGRLKPVDKIVVVLSDVEDFADREIAQLLGLSVSAVKT